MKKSLIVILSILLGLCLAAILVLRLLGGAVTINENTEVVVEEGSSTAAIAQVMQENDLIRNTAYFRIFARMNDLDGDFKAGTYTFEAGKWSVAQVCDLLILGGRSSVGEVQVTIVEGLTSKQIFQVLSDAGLGTMENYLNYAATGDFSQYAYIPAVGTEIDPATRLEGFLFPDTYMVDTAWNEQQIVDMLLAQFDSVWKDNGWQAVIDADGRSIYDVVTMAALVEKEAKIDTDRPLIAGVFYKRLEIGMNLESCATVQFILGEPKANLTYADISIDNPYNCYINAGLPPGPIASPGKASLEAAVNPQSSDYLYFRARNDGSHRFSKTFEEHSTYHEGDQ